MNDFISLKILDRFKYFFEKAGIDYKLLRKILKLKFVLDKRRPLSNITSGNRNSNKGNNAWHSYLMYGLMGMFIALYMVLPFPMFFKMNLAFGIIIFLIMTSMIADYSSVLLDVKDKSILIPRPIEPRLINISKVIHIVAYLFKIAILVAGLPLIVGTYIYGFLFFLIFLTELVLACLLIVFFTSVLYFAILFFFDGEKLKDMINYFQIILSTFMIVAYQFVGRIFSIVGTDFQFTPKWWNILLPSTWFAAPFSLFIEKDYSVYYIIFSMLGVVVPVITLILYIRVIAPHFENKLQRLDSNSSKKNKTTSKIQKLITPLICKNRTERIFYKFTQVMISNERKFKLRLYPNLAFAVVIPFIMMAGFLNGKSVKDFILQISEGKYYLNMYLSIAMLAITVLMVSASEKYKGAWIYRTLPIEFPAHILKGAFKGFTVKYIIPVFVVTSAVFAVIYGITLIPHIILMFFNMLITMLVVHNLSHKELPFSKDFQASNGDGRFSTVLITFPICGLLAGVHYVLSDISFGIVINILVSLIITFVMWRKSFNISWNKIVA